jgi:hypothetical protein
MATRRMLQAVLSGGALLAAAALAAPASAATIVATDTWYEFSFTDPGVDSAGCFPADPAGNICIPSSGTPTTFVGAPSWDIVLAAAGTFTLTDAFLSGDFFELLDFGVPQGPTPLPARWIAATTRSPALPHPGSVPASMRSPPERTLSPSCRSEHRMAAGPPISASTQPRFPHRHRLLCWRPLLLGSASGGSRPQHEVALDLRAEVAGLTHELDEEFVQS